ncbi:MAG: hypothetical protein K1X66_04770 [Verrucomicrobiae bacterium]|nr:hypothetical protein [Verrucomicrobiae bacterium]
MKISYLLLILNSFFILVGCAKKNEPTVTYVQENSVAGTALDMDNTENVRYSETLKAYPMGRYVDPNNPDVMHEAHTIYRAETQPAWNLDPNMPTAVPLGPAIAVTLPDMQQIPLSAELESKIQEQNRLFRNIAQQNNLMLKNLQTFVEQKTKDQESSSQREALEEELKTKEQMINQMRQQVETLEAQNQDIRGTYQSLQKAEAGTTNKSNSLINKLKKQFEN